MEIIGKRVVIPRCAAIIKDMKSTTKTAKRTRRSIASLFALAHAEGRAVLSHEEFLLRASLARFTDDDVADAISSEVLRRGLTGYWLRHAPDPGAIAVMRAALNDNTHAEEV